MYLISGNNAAYISQGHICLNMYDQEYFCQVFIENVFPCRMDGYGIVCLWWNAQNWKLMKVASRQRWWRGCKSFERFCESDWRLPEPASTDVQDFEKENWTFTELLLQSHISFSLLIPNKVFSDLLDWATHNCLKNAFLPKSNNSFVFNVVI